jgi:hypothetical protein
MLTHGVGVTPNISDPIRLFNYMKGNMTAGDQQITDTIKTSLYAQFPWLSGVAPDELPKRGTPHFEQASLVEKLAYKYGEYHRVQPLRQEKSQEQLCAICKATVVQGDGSICPICHLKYVSV